MPSDPWKLIFQDDLPAELHEAIAKDAGEQDITMNDAAGRVLAKRYKVPWPDTGASFTLVSASPFRLRVPSDLWLKARLDSITRGGTLRGVVLDALNEHYGFGPADVRRRPRSVAS
jgi:hypothetical protein